MTSETEIEMGEAKRRGTFEERRAKAIEIKDKLPKAHPIRPRGKSVLPLVMATIAAGMPIRNR
jgi:hypothetical protein